MVYVIMRNDSGQYYKGSGPSSFRKRWTFNFDEAKKFKRKGDASNAITAIREYHPLEVWNDTFTVFVCDLELIDEYQVCPRQK